MFKNMNHDIGKDLIGQQYSLLSKYHFFCNLKKLLMSCFLSNPNQQGVLKITNSVINRKKKSDGEINVKHFQDAKLATIHKWFYYELDGRSHTLPFDRKEAGVEMNKD